MNSDVYLFLLRQEGKFEPIKDDPAMKMKFTVGLKGLLKGMVMGDSLDLPFPKFIRVRSVGHGIGFGDNSEQVDYSDVSHEYIRGEKRNAKSHHRDTRQSRADKANRDYFANASNQERFAPNPPGNMFLKNYVPEHGSFKFTKLIDKATPQLAFGCSAQERFPFAIFFFRRKTGLGLSGIRMPYFVCGLNKVLIKSWELDGDSEKVEFSYKDIAWAAVDQISDTNVSIPGFTRYWNTETGIGGEGKWALLLQAIAGGLVLLAGGALAVASALQGDGTYKEG